MPPPATATGPPRAPRRQVHLPADLHAPFAALCEANGVTAAALLYSWLIAAARAAAHDRSSDLPHPGRRQGRTVSASWKQSDAEYATCRAALERAGTNPTAILRAAVAAYIAADGDALRMRWPPLIYLDITGH